MGLTVELSVKLDASGASGAFLQNVGGSIGDLTGISLPPGLGDLQGIVTASGGISTDSIGEAIEGALPQLLSVVADMPDVALVLGTLQQVLTQVESLSEQDLAASLEAVLARLKAEMELPPEGGRFALVMRLIDVLTVAPEGRVLHDLLVMLAGRAGIELPTGGPFLDTLRGLDGVVRALGGMMCLQSVLAETERLSKSTAALLDPTRFRDDLAAIEGMLTGPGQTLTAFVAGVDPTDSMQVSVAIDAVAMFVARFDSFHERFAASLGMGEATLVHLDLSRLQVEVDTAKTMVRTADLAAFEQLVARVAPLLQPFVDLPLSNLPAGQLGALLTQLENEVANIAAEIAAFDPATFITPVMDGIAFVTTPLRQVEQLIAEIMVALHAALGQVRDAVAALPLDEIANAIRTVLEPIADAIDAISAALETAGEALTEAAGTTTTALNTIESELTTLQETVDALFLDAKAAVETVNLSAVLGGIGQEVQAFADLVAQAQMQPYFDAASGAINTAADIVSSVPFGLLPESMKAEVDAAVRPVKQANADAVETDIRGAVGLPPGGTFQVSLDLEAAIDDIRQKYLALLDVVEQNDPRIALAQVDQTLATIRERVQELSADVALQPVADAIQSVKDLLNGIDFDALLQPVRNAFTEIETAMDRYSPSQLVQPLQERIDAVKESITGQLKLDTWEEKLDETQERLLALLDMAAPERIQPLLESGLKEVNDVLERFPEADATRGFGTVVAALLGTTGLRIYPSSFPAVTRWIGGESGSAELGVRAEGAGAAFTATRDAVLQMDIQVSAAGLLAPMAALRTAVQGLAADLAAESQERIRLTAFDVELDAPPLIASLSQNRARYLASLQTAVGLAEQFRRTGFSEVDETAERFRESLQPLAPAWQQLQRILVALGIDPSEISVAGIVRALLREATPERIADLTMPIFDAFRGRVQASLESVLQPVKDVIADLQSLLDAFDLTPLAEAADAAVEEAKTQIAQFKPDTLLAEPLASFNQLKQTLDDADPLADIQAVLTALRDLIARVLGKLSMEVILRVPLEIYDHILAELRSLDPALLLDPVFTLLDDIAHQLDTGLDETIDAFKNLQEALPAGGGGSSVSASVTVSV